MISQHEHEQFLLICFNVEVIFDMDGVLGNLERLRDTNAVVGQLNNNRKIYFKNIFLYSSRFIQTSTIILLKLCG